MRTFVRYAVALLAITVACQAGLALAEDYYWVGGGDQTAAPAAQKAAPAQPQSVCNSCCPEGCGCEPSCGASDDCCCQLGCEEQCDRVGIVGFARLDSFKGIADGSYQSNFGAVTGVNVGAGMWGLEQYGFGWQTGLSYGLYDFDGRSFDRHRRRPLATTTLRHHRLLPQGQVRSAGELRPGVRLDVQRRVGRVRR